MDAGPAVELLARRRLGLYYMNDTRWNPAPPPGDDVFLRHYRRIALAPAKLEASFSYMF